MDASLSRRLAAAYNTPFFRFVVSQNPTAKDQVTDQAVKAYVFDSLPQDTKTLILKSEQSLVVASQLYPNIQQLFLDPNQVIQVVLKVEENDSQQKQV